MKKVILPLLALLFVAALGTAKAQETVSSTQEENEPIEISYIEISPERPFVQVRSTNNTLDNLLNANQAQKRRRAYSHDLTFSWGLTNYLDGDGNFPDNDNAPYALNTISSPALSLASVHKFRIVGPLKIELSGAIDWMNFRFENDRMRVAENDATGQVEFFEDPRTDIEVRRSKMKVTYLSARAVPVLEFGGSRGFRIGAGVYAGYRLSNKSKLVYREDGNKQKDKTRADINVNNFRYGVRAQLGFGGVDLFATYDLNTLFQEGNGPELYPIAFGLVF